jgi:thiol-disulfide isomerase/thioredoxin
MNIISKIVGGVIVGLLFFTGVLGAQTVKVKAVISSCDQPIKLFEYNGFSFRESMEAKKMSGDIYEISLPKMEMPRVYFIGPGGRDVKPIILGNENMVAVMGKCGKMRVAQISNSSLNDEFDELKKEISTLRSNTIQLTRKLRMAKDEESRQEILTSMAQLDEKKKNLLDSLNQTNPFFAKTVALNTYLSFLNNKGSYRTEILYFAQEYFRFANFEESAYNNLPWLTDAIRTYTQTLINVGLDEDSQKRFLNQLIERFPKNGQARQLALAGIIQSYERNKNSNYIHFGELFIEEYSEKEPQIAAQIKTTIEQERSFMVGGTPPDFTQKAPDGSEISLSDLRGKVVLIDFWASWCGPCRRENPNVVRLYEKYREKGFEIIGVSLDRSRDRWLQAIDQDGLGWLHVSDLKHWQNEVAQLYNVSSIPKTYLLDAEGKIIGKNLRGQQLANKLSEIFEGSE